MKSFRVFLTAIMFVLIAAFSAYAADVTLFSPAVRVTSPQLFVCQIVNIGISTETVEVAIVDIGSANAVAPPTVFTIGPGQGGGAGVQDQNAILYCKFTVKSKVSNFRGNVTIYDPNDVPLVALPAY